MSRIKDLKNQPENNVNIIDMLNVILYNEKTVYYELMLRIMKGTKDLKEVNKEIKFSFRENFGTPDEIVNSVPDFQLAFYYKFIENLFNVEDVKTFKRFCDLNEKSLINPNDVSKYQNFDEIKKAVDAAELKLSMKDLEKQTVKVYEDDIYLIVRPLTYLSSKKYGANTKWCTTSVNDYSYFKKYASNGILLYILNKENNIKTACFYSLVEDKEFSFWNQIDQRIDSLQSDLPFNILNVIKNEINTNPRSNRSYLTTEEKKKDDIMNEDIGKKMSIDDGDIPADLAVNVVREPEVMAQQQAYIETEQLQRESTITGSNFDEDACGDSEVSAEHMGLARN